MFISAFFELLKDVLFLTGYVSGNAVFPNPLPPTEEKKYFSLYKAGDEKAKNILIEHNLRLVAHIAKKYSPDYDLDDLISIGTIGLIKAINTFDSDKNSRLATYAARCIENEILMMVRSSKKINNEISIDDSIGVDKEGNNLTFADILAADISDAADALSEKTEIKKLYNSMSSVLNENEFKILCWHYGLYNTQKKTQNEIADILGISRSYVSRIEKKAIKKLSEIFTNYYN